jgi:hypothetical protein
MKAFLVLLVVVVFVTGCATQGDQARTEGSLVGAGVGAALGAGVGYAIGGAKGAGIGAGIGALAGGASGYVYADRVAKRHEALAGKENDLNARITFARGINDDTREYNERLKKEVGALEPKIAELEAKRMNQQVTQQELQKQKQALTARTEEANKQLAVCQNELDGLQKFRSQQAAASSALDEQISTLERNLAQMKANTIALASLNQRI